MVWYTLLYNFLCCFILCKSVGYDEIKFHFSFHSFFTMQYFFLRSLMFYVSCIRAKTHVCVWILFHDREMMWNDPFKKNILIIKVHAVNFVLSPNKFRRKKNAYQDASLASPLVLDSNYLLDRHHLTHASLRVCRTLISIEMLLTLLFICTNLY